MPRRSSGAADNGPTRSPVTPCRSARSSRLCGWRRSALSSSTISSRSISLPSSTCCPWSWRRHSGGSGPKSSRLSPGAAAADFFFYPPFYTFWIRDPQNVVDLILFLLIAVVTSNLAARLKNEAVALRRREKEITDLHAFSQGLATCLTSHDLIFAVQDYLSNTLRYRAVLIATEQEAHAHAATVPDEIRQAASELIANKAPAAATAIDPRNGRTWLVQVITPEILGYGAIAVDLGDGRGEHTETTARRVEALLEEATLTLKHLKTKEAIEEATLNYQAEILRDALIGGVSHELRTPLATILGSCSVLKRMPAIRSDHQSRELIEAINEQAGQLDNEIRNLLDATRISAKGVRPQLMWSDPTDIVSAALKQKERKLAAHRVVLDIERKVPFVHVDTVLVEQALGQILENAAKYSPAGSEIKISSRCEEGCVTLSVKDQGSGLTADEKGQVGRKPFRGHGRGIGAGGSGLGLWIPALHRRQRRQPACRKPGAASRHHDVGAVAHGVCGSAGVCGRPR